MPRPDEIRSPGEIRRELLGTWGKCLALLALAKALSFVEPTGLLGANLAGVAAFLFVALPDSRLRVHHEHWDAYGLEWWGLRDPRTWRAWAKGAAIAILAGVVTFPAFAACFWAYAEYLPDVPGPIARFLAPYALPPTFSFRLPPDLLTRIAVQLLVVALPEEMFYRGWIQTSWARTAPGQTVHFLGADVGKGFVATQLLFAAGHLVVLQPWRLATFFPGLLFGWLRERTGSLTAPVLYHALSNVFIATLEASFYG